jgi:hypothetical protein
MELLMDFNHRENCGICHTVMCEHTQADFISKSAEPKLDIVVFPTLLILDDEDYRHELIAKQYPNHERFHARNLVQFKKHLRRVGRFDIITFDHDISDDERETGVEAAIYLISLGKHYIPGLCIVHSWNTDGAKNIEKVLLEAKYPVEINNIFGFRI